MKKNAALIAGIMFVAGCASSQGQRASYSHYDSPSQLDRADVSVSSTEHIERTPSQSPIPTSDVDVSSSVSHGSSVGTSGSSISGSVSGGDSLHDEDISADSSVRGGSLDARGYDQDANEDELEGQPDPINPGKQADSSIRGGSVYARERNWNHDAEPSAGEHAADRHLKADSSIRGGSIEARGGREAAEYRKHSDAQSGFNADAHIRAAQDDDDRDDFGQGSSATWESDKASGSVRGSANWNSSDDLMLDGTDSEPDATSSFEINNDASVGGAARSEIDEASSLDDEELESQTDSSSASGYQENDSDSSLRIESDLNSSEQLESNISGEIDLDEQESTFDSSLSGTDENSPDRFSGTSSSASVTDIYHDEADLTAPERESSIEIEAAGAAAVSESGSASSSEESFESNDPAMNKAGSPLGTAGNEPNFHYQDNRAQGVGSAATGEFASSPVNLGADVQVSDDQLAQKVKGTLTRESTGTHGLMMHEVARNVQVSSQDGKVTLTGTVPSEKYKDMIEIRAREISGVKSIDNQLTVTPEADAAHRDITRGSDLEDVTSDLQN